MPTCVVKWCRSNLKSKCPGITFHYFPVDPSRKKKWVAAVQLERQAYDWMPVKTSRVCSIHFNKKDFYKSSKGNSMLHKTAVPVCTMIRPEETTTSLRDTIENEKINNSERLQLGNNIKTECNDDVEEDLRNYLVPKTFVNSYAHMLKQKIRKKTILAEKRLSQIQNLSRRNKRLTMKYISLKNVLSQLQKNLFSGTTENIEKVKRRMKHNKIHASSQKVYSNVKLK